MYPILHLFLVEHRGFEPLTPTLPVLCAPSCANAPPFNTIIVSHFLSNVKHFLSMHQNRVKDLSFDTPISRRHPRDR